MHEGSEKQGNCTTTPTRGNKHPGCDWVSREHRLICMDKTFITVSCTQISAQQRRRLLSFTQWCFGSFSSVMQILTLQSRWETLIGGLILIMILFLSPDSPASRVQPLSAAAAAAAFGFSVISLSRFLLQQSLN